MTACRGGSTDASGRDPTPTQIRFGGQAERIDQLSKFAAGGHDTRALQAYLGHKNIQHTVRYTELAPDRFKDFWR